MVRRAHFHRSVEHDLDVTMTPMIDVVFLLLIFFVWTAGFQLVEYVLPSQLSQQAGRDASEMAEPTPEQDYDNVIIRLQMVGASPSWTINQQPVASLEAMESQLRRLAEVKLDAPIVIHPDQDVPVGYVIETYDVAKMAQFQKVSFAVSSL